MRHPFGGERVVASGSGNAYKFTGKERDPKSALDYFIARYYASTLGRFLSPDPGERKLVDPQTLNRYAFSLNRPVRFADPDGQFVPAVHKDIANRILESMGYSESVRTSIVRENLAVDWDFQDENHAFMHSQSRRIDGIDQTPQEASAEQRSFVDATIDAAAAFVLEGEFGKARQQVGRALHAVQDEKHEFTPYRLHQGKPSDLSSSLGRKQIRTDFFPSPEQVRRAEQRTRQTIRRFEDRIREQGRKKGLSDAEIEARIRRFWNHLLERRKQD